MPREDGLPPGTLVMLILRVLASQPLHGYAIAQRIAQLSRDELSVEEGSLYPGAAEAAAEGVGQGGARRLRDRPPGPRIPAHRGRAQAARDRARELPPRLARHRCRAGDRVEPAMSTIAEWFRRVGLSPQPIEARRGASRGDRVAPGDDGRTQRASAITLLLREQRARRLGMAMARRRRARPAVRGADARPIPGIFHRDDRLPGARDGRDDRHLQHRQRRAAEAAAIRGARSSGAGPRDAPHGRRGTREGSPISASSGGRAHPSIASPATT